MKGDRQPRRHGRHRCSIHHYLKVDQLQVFHQRDQQPAVVELLGQLGHRLGVRLLIVATVQDLLHGHQTLGHLLGCLEKTGGGL